MWEEEGGLRKGTELGVALSFVTYSDSLVLLVGTPGGYQLEATHRKVDERGIFSGSPRLVLPPAPTTPPSAGQHPSRPTSRQANHGRVRAAGERGELWFLLQAG